MFVPFISKRAVEDSYDDIHISTHEFEKRRGGGGRGGGSSGGGGGGGGGGTGPKTSLGGTASGRTSSPYSYGGAPKTTIPAGSTFAGRDQGGANRGQIYGGNNYGSGYPDRNYNSRGVGGYGFPFFFWPVAWGGAAGAGGGAYLHNREYGDPNNGTRPGGPMYYSTYVSQDSTKNSTFHIVADNSTITELMADIAADCGGLINNSTSTVPGTRNATAMSNSSTTQPQPESSVQYYRASSISLTLDGYNNTAALSDNDNATADPLPNNYDGSLLACLNTTIGEAALLVDGSAALFLLPGWLMLGVGVSVGALMSV